MCFLIFKEEISNGRRTKVYKVGFKRLYVGVFNREATKVVKRMTWEDEKGGTVDLNITGLAPDLVDMFASNKRVWMKKQGTNEVKSDMSIFNIPSDDLNTVIGRTKDKNGTSWEERIQEHRM